MVEMEDLRTVFVDVVAKILWPNHHHLRYHNEAYSQDTVGLSTYIYKVINIYIDKTQIW